VTAPSARVKEKKEREGGKIQEGNTRLIGRKRLTAKPHQPMEDKKGRKGPEAEATAT